MNIEDIITGNTYKIRDWDDMVQEYGLSQLHEVQFIKLPGGHVFTPRMRRLCGSEVTVLKKLTHEDRGEFTIITDVQSVYKYSMSSDMLKPADDLIDIQTDLVTFCKGILKI